MGYNGSNLEPSVPETSNTWLSHFVRKYQVKNKNGLEGIRIREALEFLKTCPRPTA
jgi:hypothetical protein